MSFTRPSKQTGTLVKLLRLLREERQKSTQHGSVEEGKSRVN